MKLPLVAPAKCEVRSIIRFLNAKKVTPIEIYRQLTGVYEEKCMDVKNVRKCCRKFFSGRKIVHDEERSGRPSHSDATVKKGEEHMLQNRKVTLDDMAKNLE